MMEVMIVIAILGVLAALIFVNVIPFMKSLYGKEMDETAEEIYVAAQNHMTIADSMGFLEGKTDGTPVAEGSDIYYFVVGQGGSAQTTTDNKGEEHTNGVTVATSKLSQMLPFGSIDDTVRLGGSYVISYNAKHNTIEDVFYANPNGRYGNGVNFAEGDYDSLVSSYKPHDGTDAVTEAQAKANRMSQNFGKEDGKDGAIIGWYGGKGAGLDAEPLTAPKVVVDNAERLNVRVYWPTEPASSSDLEVSLIITGKTSKNHTPLIKMVNPYTATGTTTSTGATTNEWGYIGCLDDITTTYASSKDLLAEDNGHFVERFSKYGLIPGEDVTISVFAYYTKAVGEGDSAKLYKVAKCPKVTTNSLFESVGKVVDSSSTTYSEARIGNIRHLENLAQEISGYDRAGLNGGTPSLPWSGGNTSGLMVFGTQSVDDDPMTMASAEANGKEGTDAGTGGGQNAGGAIGGSAPTYDPAPTHARQTKNLSWPVFLEKTKPTTGNTESVVTTAAPPSATVARTKAGTYKPVETGGFELASGGTNLIYAAYNLTYEGGNHSITGVKVDASGAAGLFGALDSAEIKNVELINFNVKSEDGNAGALAGALTNSRVSGVLVYNEAAANSNDAALEITGVTAAGGLVGSMTGGSVEKSAASVYVRTSTGPAGGLVGIASGVAVSDCYSGGHTVDGSYKDSATADEAGRINVISASSNAGGLIGTATNSNVAYSYSTCSAYGSGSVGGLIGEARVANSGSMTISNTYATGLVAVPEGTTTIRGLLVGSLGAGVTLENNSRYVESFTQVSNNDGSVTFKKANGSDVKAIGLDGTDQNAEDDKDASDLVADMFPDLATYREIVTANDDFTAHPYDSTLLAAYRNHYALPTVVELGKGKAQVTVEGEGGNTTTNTVNRIVPTDPAYAWLSTHYGDWPKMEVEVVNTPA